jgi:cytochrome P450
MSSVQPVVIPPAPPVHAKDLSTLSLVRTSARDTLAIWPNYAFEVPFSRRTVLGVEAVLLNDPAAIRHVMTTNVANYRRPVMTARILRPLLGRGILLSEGAEWRRQRRMLSTAFTPQSVGLLLPHFFAAADDLVRSVERAPTADLALAFQSATLEAVLRALFSMPDAAQREPLAAMVRSFATGPGRFTAVDSLAPNETSFPFLLRKRRAFQKAWFAVVDDVIAERRRAPNHGGPRDLLDMLLTARDTETGAPLAADEVRDQSATMIFGGHETTSRLLFWATYLLTLDPAEQDRLRAEVADYPPDRARSLADLGRWPRLRLVLLEALRLYPSVAHLVREPIDDDVVAGERVRRGTQVWISPWVMHRHRTYWESPTAFRPDRFAGQPSPWTALPAYLPFGAGPRICLGAAFAMAEAQIMLATLLSRFRISLDGGAPVLPVGRLTIEPSRAPGFRLERV